MNATNIQSQSHFTIASAGGDQTLLLPLPSVERAAHSYHVGNRLVQSTALHAPHQEHSNVRRCDTLTELRGRQQVGHNQLCVAGCSTLNDPIGGQQDGDEGK